MLAFLVFQTVLNSSPPKCNFVTFQVGENASLQHSDIFLEFSV